MDVPLVCSLQDEDIWVDAMKPEFREKIWKLMHDKSAYVDAFIAVSRYYAGIMTERMDLPSGMVIPVYLGVDPAEYEFYPSAEKERNIGYISRMCYENGLDIAVDAFILLKKEAAFSDVKLVITGGSTSSDSKYISGLKKKIHKAGLNGSVDFYEVFVGAGRKEFFRKTSIASVPVRKGEAFGIYLPELMASGIPVIQPALGAFPEIVQLAGGGLIYSPNTPEKLAESWVMVLSDRKFLTDLSYQARKGVEESFNIHDHAREMVDVYHQLSQNKKHYVTGTD
jgi:glycosyltransferase involved in cell wall biosynthesis